LALCAIPTEERLIVEAALGDPHLIEGGRRGRFNLGTRTVSLGEGSIGLLAVEDWQSQLDSTRTLIRISDDLMNSLREHNRQRIRIRGITKPSHTERSADRRVGYWKTVSISRPGVSSDGLTALVAIAADYESYTAFLEKRDGQWRVSLPLSTLLV
jgi:hypothetical protein